MRLGQFEDISSAVDLSALSDLVPDVNPEGSLIESLGTVGMESANTSGIDWSNLLSNAVQGAGKLAPAVAQIVQAVRTGNANITPYGTGKIITMSDGTRYLVGANGTLTKLGTTGLFGTTSSTSTLILLAIGAFLLLRK